MRILTTLILIIAFFSCEPVQDEPKPNQEQALGELTHLKEVLWPKAYREQDTLLLDKILGDDFRMIDASGIWSDKEFEMNWIKKNSTSYDSFYYEIKRLEILDNGTAIICGTGHIFNDTTETIYQSSNVLEWRKNEWKAVLSHVSGIKEM